MIVSHKHKFIFLKTRKTASTSTELALFPHCGPDDLVTPLTPTELTRSIRHRAQNHIRPAFPLDPRPGINRFHQLEGFKFVDFHDHIRADVVRSYVGKTVWDSYYKFSFERNIYDRQVSWFHYRTRKPWKKKRWPTFEAFMATSPEARIDNFLIYTISGEVAVDFIGRYESLQEDLGKVLEKLHLPKVAQMPVAKTGMRLAGNSYREYYTPETRARVESWYPGELQLFDDTF